MIRKYIVHEKNLLLYALLSITPVAVFLALTGTSTTDILYCMLLMVSALVLLLALRFPAYYTRMKALTDVLSSLDEFFSVLPETDDPVENAYRDAAVGLQERLQRETASLEKKHRTAIEYYTLWMHQIKTPIAALWLMLESGAPEKEIRSALFHIERYVEMALHYVKSETLGSDTVISRVDTMAVVKESVKKYAPLFIGKGLGADVDSKTLHVYTDAKWLAFIVEQLISNAIKYTKQGVIRIYSESNMLIVEDTGIGIRAEDLPLVFERGYTGHTGRLDKRASGIGLYLANKIAGALHMRMEIGPREGGGTRARIVFPSRPPEMIE